MVRDRSRRPWTEYWCNQISLDSLESTPGLCVMPSPVLLDFGMCWSNSIRPSFIRQIEAVDKFIFCCTFWSKWPIRQLKVVLIVLFGTWQAFMKLASICFKMVQPKYTIGNIFYTSKGIFCEYSEFLSYPLPI